MNKPHVTIGLIGLPNIEEKRLHAAFNFSRARDPSYMEEELDNVPNILMVNADEPSSLIAWRSYRNKLEDSGFMVPPSVVVSKNREFNTKHYQVKRPLITSRVISILDQVAVNELSLDTGSLIIDKDNDTSNSSEARLERTFPSVNDAAKLPRALVVDDSLPVRIQMDQALKSCAKVDFAESGEEALPLLQKNQYDLIFLDVVLPGIDGYEVCKKIKQSISKNTPVIMLTGNSSPADRIKGKLAGCDTYLIKPISQTIFNEVIRQYINT